jgi:dihydroflavonol-4-reductase
MRAFLTGATGFVMGAVARRLRAWGDEVVALVRSRSRARDLEAGGCELVEGGLLDISTTELRGCDALIHGAAIYEIGVNDERRRQMVETNVEGTRRVLDTARQAAIGRTLFISTIAAFGNTRGAIVSEGFEPHLPPTTAYEDTKRQAHQLAAAAIRAGQPIVIVQPGQVFGPDDHSGIGTSLRALAAGRLRYLAFLRVGLSFVHIDDVAEGIVRALDGGRLGESYVLGGEIARLGDAYRAVADVTGRPLPRVVVPDQLLRLAARFSPALRETVTSADGVTFWASDAKARAELGTRPRGLREGMRDTFGRADGTMPTGWG